MSGALRALFLIGDLILLNFSVLVPLGYGKDMDALLVSEGTIYLVVFSNLAWLFLVMVSPPYNINRGWTVSMTLKSQLAFVFIHLLIVASLVFFFKQSYSLVQIAMIYVIFIPLFFLLRVSSYYFRKVFGNEIEQKNFMLIGRNDLAQEIRKYFLINADEGYRFAGYIEDDTDNLSIDRIREFAEQHNIQEIFCCAPNVSDEKLKELIDFGMNSLIKVKVVSAWQNQSIKLSQFDQQPGFDQATVALDESRHRFVKRVFDLVFSFTFTVLVLSWLVPIIGIIIKIDSRGPIFFVQLRSGRSNRPFKCFKFRTMKVNAQADTQQASRNDPRITKLGYFLRRTSIDELPQFLNVLIGTMSIVGPRPHMLKHTEEYSKLIDRFMGRHYVKPGITGLAQCLGYRGETKDIADMENRVRMDRYYIEHWTFWFDIKIIFLTVVSLIRGSDKAF